MTSQEQTAKAPPDADAILKQFRSPLLRICRFILLSTLRVVKYIRRVKWTATGTEQITSTTLPIIFASNHQSHVDTHVILHTLPKIIRTKTAVAAAFDHFADREGTSKKKRLIQFIVASLWHAFGIERIKSPLSSIRTMQELLSRGWSIVIYPEGTRSRSGEIAKFKGGLAVIAKRSGRPVVPVFVDGGMKILPEATYIPFPGTVRVFYGEPLHFQKDERSADFMLRVESSVRELARQV
jgi:1-acyl-sn-glycerol-3-phosphate acyltransferase